MKSATSGPEQITVTPVSCARADAVTSAPIPDDDPLDDLARARDVVTLARPVFGARCPERLGARDDVRGREADTEQSALALRDDLELTRSRGRGLARAARARAAQPTSPRRPSRRSPRPSPEPGRSPSRPSASLALHAPRRTARARASARRPGTAARRCSTPSGSSFGGVLLDRLGGTAGLGICRRVTMPCPVVHRFVVSQ